jgi:hypothetical protein
MFGLLSALFLGLHRIFAIRLESWISSLLLMGFTTFFLLHISYLSLYRFDYGYNMKASIAVAVAHNLFWLAWAFIHRKSVPHAWKAGFLVILLTLASLFEVFDFAPWFGVLDAHSLWHAATIPTIRIYWEFLLEDARYLVRK